MAVINGLNWAKERLLVNIYVVVAVLGGIILLCILGPAFSDFVLVMLRSEMVFSHLFYLPVALASLILGMRGILVALLIGLAWIAAYFLSDLNVPPQEYFPQPMMFIIIGTTVGLLREQTLRSEKELRNRVKELNCLFSISTLREKPGLVAADILQGTVDLIPAAWQYPDITCARIILEGQICTTRNFVETPWRQDCPIVVHDEPIGILEVYYLEAQPRADEGPFLREERRLLNAIAERLGKIVQRERAEVALRKSEATNRALVSAIPDTIWRLHADGTLLDFKNAKEATPFSLRATARGQHVAELLSATIAHEILRCAAQALDQGATQTCEYQVSSNGTPHYYEARLVVSGDQEVLAIVRDITDRKARENLIAEERIRIARDLHDGLAQSLYFLGLKLDFIRKHVTRDPDGVIAELVALKETTQRCIQDVRRTIFALRPLDLERQGLAPTVQQYAHEFGEHMGLNVLLNVNGNAEKLSTSLELAFFRLVQEGLNNIAKHAKARQVWIDLNILPDRIGQLTIRDDGVGFDPETVSTNGNGGGKMGLYQMRERVASLGGLFRIESMPTQGTTLCTEIPL